VKTVRLLSTQRGYSVSLALVSAVRKTPPSAAEIREFERPTAVEPLTKGLVGWWKFDEGSGATAGDTSGKEHPGTLVRNPQWVPGKVGSALSVTRDQYARIPHSDDLAFKAQESYTLALWVNVSTPEGGPRAIFSKSRDVAPWYGLWVSGGRWVAGASDKGGLDGGPAASGWHHLALVQEGTASQRHVYVDGKKTASGPARDASGPGEIRIGAAKSVSEYLTGQIDDVRLYNRALPAAEIALLLEAP
jgi:hypothetical protein